MYKTQTNKVAIRTQKAIAAAFLSLIEERAYEDISVTEICKKADVVRKSFYNNFQSKDDVVCYLLNDIFQQIEAMLDLRNMSIKQILLIAFDFVINNRQSLLLFYKRGLIKFAGKSISAYITKDHILTKFNKNAVDPRAYKYIAAQTPAVLISVIETWIENGFEEPIEFLAQLTEDLMYKPNSANN